MSIELHFLQKAIKDKNFIGFSYNNKNYKKIKPLNISNNILKSLEGEFDITLIKKLTILKERF